MRALLEGRYNVSFEDVRRVYLPALRHRVILNFEAQAEDIDTDQVLLEILEKVPEKAEADESRVSGVSDCTMLMTTSTETPLLLSPNCSRSSSDWSWSAARSFAAA